MAIVTISLALFRQIKIDDFQTMHNSLVIRFVFRNNLFLPLHSSRLCFAFLHSKLAVISLAQVMAGPKAKDIATSRTLLTSCTNACTYSTQRTA